MVEPILPGYAGALLRVDLNNERFSRESPDEATWRKYLGGTGIGAKYLYDEVPPGVEWSDSQNRLIIASGPLGGAVHGSGTFSVVTKGPMSNGATSSQANGFLGAFLKFSGFDGIIVHGAAQNWVYLYIHDGQAELRDAQRLLGRDTWETENLIKKELGFSESRMSVFSIGPAGENLVRFAAIVGDRGHVASHNGVGAVMGSKRLKAIAVARGNRGLEVKDKEKLRSVSDELLEVVKNDPQWGLTYKWGMLWGPVQYQRMGFNPVKNYQTNVFPIESEKLEKFEPAYIRSHYDPKPHPCWRCNFHHCHKIRITEGPYTGYVGEEPEAESMTVFTTLIGNPDVPSMIMLSNEVDRIGMCVNETGWVIGFVMECFEKGLLNKQDTGGLEMTWGNVEATRAMLQKIARRQGLGDILAEGVMRASQRLGGDAPNMAIHTMSGTTLRSHDLRLHWPEMFDTCVSNVGTIENDSLGMRPSLMGFPELSDRFSPEAVSTLQAKTKGHFQFLDSLGVCKFPNRHHPEFLVGMVKAATGWDDFSWEEALKVGLRAVSLMRAFNVRHGRRREHDAPSTRLGSIPKDGPAKGKGIIPVWDKMVDNYYKLLGWDQATGKPLQQTLNELGLQQVAKDLWPKKGDS